LCSFFPSSSQSESQFIRELAEISLKQTPHQSIQNQNEEDLFEALERLEITENTSTSEPQPIAKVDKRDEGEKDFLSSKKWKKGFLSTSDSKKVIKTASSQPDSNLLGKISGNQTTQGSSTPSVSKSTSIESSISSTPQLSQPRSMGIIERNTEKKVVLERKNELNPNPSLPTKRVSKFMAERAGANLSVSDESDRSSLSNTIAEKKAFTGRIVER
jgi:hypothetical protein